MKHLGDITKINGAEIEPVWCVTGGSPCQDLSVAGKRKGLAGERSGLFMEQIRIVKEMREHDRSLGRTGESVRPRFMVWENVPGAFSSNFSDGFGDFGAVLEETCRIAEPGFSLPRLPGKQKWTKAGCILGDGWSVAWRTHDAQYWGVPQRRRRIALVADFGGEYAGEILFEREGVPGDTGTSEPTWERTPGDASHRTGATGYDGYNGELTGEVSSTLGVNCGMSTGRNGIVLNDQGGNRMDITDEVTATLRAEANHPPVVMEAAGFCTEHSAKSRSIGLDGYNGRNARVNEQISGTLQAKANGGFSYNCVNPVAYGISSYDSNAMRSDNPHSGIYEQETSRTLDLNGGNPACNQGGVAVVFEPRSQDGVPRIHGDISPTLNTAQGGQRQPCVALTK